MKKGIIFDFDGLLVDTEVIWYEILRDYFEQEHNHEFAINVYNGFVGSSGSDLLRNLFLDCGVDHDEVMPQIRDEFVKRSNDLGFMPGISELIDEIKSFGLKMGIATSSPSERPHRILGEMGKIDVFDYIIAREDVESAKPAPDLFLKALDTMGLKKEEVIIFEDSYNGYLAAKASGIDVVIVVNEVSKHSDFGEDVEVLSSMLDFDLKGYVNDK